MQIRYTFPIVNYLLKTCLIAIFLGFSHWSSNVAIAQLSLVEIEGIVNDFGLNSQNSDLTRRFIQFSKNDIKRVPILPNEIDISQRSVIWLSCRPGGLKANSTLIIHRPIIVQPSEIFLAEMDVWHDMRLNSIRKRPKLMNIYQRRPERLQNDKAQFDRPKLIEAKGWIKTKDAKTMLTGRKPVKQFIGSQLSPDSCHSR